jgi:hypothetical protein
MTSQPPEGYGAAEPQPYEARPFGDQAGPVYQPPASANAYGQPTPYGAAPYPGDGQSMGSTEKNSQGTVALIFGILGMTALPFIGALIGVIFGHLGLGSVKRGRADNRGQALAGLILGYIGLAMFILTMIFVIIVISMIASQQEFTNEFLESLFGWVADIVEDQRR